MNKVILVGNLVDKAFKVEKEDIYLFTIAVNESYKDKNGQWQTYANFINCSVSGNLGKAFGEHGEKGDKLIIDGKLNTWNKKENNLWSHNYKVKVKKLNWFQLAKNTKTQDAIPNTNNEPEPTPPEQTK